MVKEHENFKKLIANSEVSVESKNGNSTLADELLSKTTPAVDVDPAIVDLKAEAVDKVRSKQPQFDVNEPLTDIPANKEEFIDDQPTEDQPAPTIDIDSAIDDLNTQVKTETVDKVPEQPEQTFDSNEPTDIPSIKEITKDESSGKLPKSKDSSSSKDK